jgi:hypothetical protein
MPTLDPGFAVLAREEADVVPDLGEGDVGHNLRNLRVESERGEYAAQACYGWLWDGKVGGWCRGEHIYAPRGRDYEGQLCGMCRGEGKKGGTGRVMERTSVNGA